MSFSTLGIDLVARIAKFEEDMAKATKSVAAMDKKFSAMGSTIKSVLGSIGVGFTIKEFASLAKSGIDAADAMNDMSQRLGVSVKDLASFRLAAEQSGTSLDSVGTGIARLSRSIGEAEADNKKLAKTLTDLGITAKDPKEAFFQLADAVQRIDDPTKRATLLNQVLGKSYNELVPLLNQGSEALRASAASSETFAKEMAKLAPDADKFNDNLAQLKSNAAGAAAALLNELVPAMNKILENINQAIRLNQSGFGFLQLLGFGVNPTAAPAQQLKDVNDELRETESTLARLRKNSSGPNSDIGVLDARVKELKRLKNILLNQVVEAMNAPPITGKKTGTNGFTDFSKTLSEKSKTDPLASLLASTDIGKLKEFDKQVALLNSRFNYGKKDAELYAQAMTKLVESTFSDKWKQAADDAEFFRMVEEDGIKTTQEWRQNLIDLANVDMARLQEMLDNTDFSKLKKDQEDMILLAKAFSEGIKDADGNLRKLSESEYLDAIKNRLDIAKESIDELDTFAKTAAENIQNSFTNFLANPFDDTLKGMAQSFGQMIKKMIDDAVAADLTKWLFGDLIKGGTGKGVAGGLLSTIGGLFSFDGGGYTGSGSRTGGIDGMGGFLSVLHPNETVVDHTKGQRSGHTIIVNVNGGSAPDVRRAAGQGAREALGMFGGAQRYA